MLLTLMLLPTLYLVVEKKNEAIGDKHLVEPPSI
jgi:hypothetical protein